MSYRKLSRTRRYFIATAFLNFTLKYAITEVQQSQVELELNGTYQRLAYVGGVDLLGNNVDTRKKNAETLIEGNKEVDIEVNSENTKYINMLLSRHQNLRQNPDKKKQIDRL
jgi:hypothetical protein